MTIEGTHEVSGPPQAGTGEPKPGTREAINKEVQWDYDDKAPGMTWGKLMDGIEIALKDSKTAAEHDHILNSPQVQRAKVHVTGKARERLDDLLRRGKDRRDALAAEEEQKRQRPDDDIPF